MLTLAIDIGGTKFLLAAFDGETMIARELGRTHRDGGAEWMLEQIATILNGWRERYRFDRCGVGFGGPVNYAEQRVYRSTHVSGWDGLDLPGFLRERTGAPVVIDNDANLGALGEAVYGAGRGFRPLFFVTLSTGIGGGIVLEGDQVFRGADTYAGEIGHLVIRPDGPECLCGAHGCFERLCCGLWLERDHGRPASELMQDPEFVKRYVVDVALGLKTAVMLLNPARIVVGGGISNAGDLLFAPLRKELRRQITAWSHARVDLVPAALDNDSVLYGALALANRERMC